MDNKTFAWIYKRTKGEWVQYLRDQWVHARVWLQENGELSAACGIVLGMALVLFVKPVLVVLVVAALAGALVWALAPAEHTPTVMPKDSSDSVSSVLNGHSDTEDKDTSGPSIN